MQRRVHMRTRANGFSNNAVIRKISKSALSASLWTFVQLAPTACGAVRSESESGQMHPFLYFLVQQAISFSSKCTAKIPSPFPVRGSIFWIDFQPTRPGVAQRAGKIRYIAFFSIKFYIQRTQDFFQLARRLSDFRATRT